MNCSRKIFFWNNSYFLEQLTDFSGTIHIFWHNWQIQGWQNMPFPKDLKTKHLGRLFLCQLEQFIYLLKNTILIGHDIILKNIYLTILPKNYFLEANLRILGQPTICGFSASVGEFRNVPYQNQPHSFWRWFFSLGRWVSQRSRQKRIIPFCQNWPHSFWRWFFSLGRRVSQRSPSKSASLILVMVFQPR